MIESVKGKKYPNHKPNTTYSSGRSCLEKGCSTIISKYNKFKHCNNHKQRVYPRIKGRKVPTDLQEPLS